MGFISCSGDEGTSEGTNEVAVDCLGGEELRAATGLGVMINGGLSVVGDIVMALMVAGAPVFGTRDAADGAEEGSGFVGFDMVRCFGGD